MECRIELTNGKFALVDEEDYEIVKDFHWFTTNNSKEDIACFKLKLWKKRVFLHRFIMNEHNPEIYICPINGNYLDCRKSNLERRTWSQVMTSRKEGRTKPNKTGYRGVSFHKATGNYRAQIKKMGKTINLGHFDDPKEAALAYDKKALELFGEKYGRINFKDRKEEE